MAHIQSQSLKPGVAYLAPLEDIIEIDDITPVDPSFLDQGKVNEFEESIEEIGLINRIGVIANDPGHRSFSLFLGKYRYAAWLRKWDQAKKSGDLEELARWQHIPVSIYPKLPVKMKKLLVAGEALVHEDTLGVLSKKTVVWRAPPQVTAAGSFNTTRNVIQKIFARWLTQKKIIATWTSMSESQYADFCVFLKKSAEDTSSGRATVSTISSRVAVIEKYLTDKDPNFTPW